MDLAKPKSRARIFFYSRTTKGHNALPRPGLEPGSSDSEPSALTTGLQDKTVALACPRYSWPRMIKVAPCTVVQLYIQIFWLDGLLLFCIIMGLRSASSAINQSLKKTLKAHFQPWCNARRDPISCNTKFPDHWKSSKIVFLKSHPGHIVNYFTVNTFAVRHFTVS